MYGQQYIKALKEHYQDNGTVFYIVDGTADMSQVYPIIDLYVKFNTTRFNTLGRIAEECFANNIPIVEVNTYQDQKFDHFYKINKAISVYKKEKDE